MVHYHKKNNHNVSNFLGLKIARNIVSNLAYTMVRAITKRLLAIYLVPCGYVNGYHGTHGRQNGPNDPVGVATAPKNLVAVVKDPKDPAVVVTDPMHVAIDPNDLLCVAINPMTLQMLR